MSAGTTFTTIRSVGGLLPTSLLGRLTDLDQSLPGTTPSSFGLDGTKRVNEPIAPAWNRLKTRWGAFTSSIAELGPDERGTVETREFLIALLGELGLAVTAGSIDVGEDRYPISHVADDYPVPVHLLSTRIDIDRTTKGVEGAATRAPHGLVQELLNRSDDHLWALVAGGTGMEEGDTDGGLVLRLLRDNQSMTRQAFVEFDLAAMFDGDLYADFVVLWLTLHHTRFAGDTPADCLLEQWLNAAEEAGARALDTLRDGVEDAITRLGTGLLRHPDNTELRQRLQDGEIDAEELYRQLLRVVYRLLFLFVAEDRDLLLTPADEAKPQARERFIRWYSTARLRVMARGVGGGRHSDLWRQLTRVLHELGSDTGCEELALPPLGGGLFSSAATADAVGQVGDTTALRNGDLLDAIRDLAWTVDDGVVRSVDFRNLGSEELGSVYESLLELVPRASATGQEFKLETVAGNARKSTGSYYTPSSLIKILLDGALDPLLDEAEEAESPEAELLSLTVCDPASGSGHFLVAAANRIAERLAAVRSGDGEPSPVELQQALRDVVSHCIYGVDVNPMAAELAKVTLWLECHVPGTPMTFLDHHIKVGNSLIGVGFDTSIADWNPEGRLVDDRGGIPDAAFRVHTGDDKSAAKKYKSRSRSMRDQKKGAERDQMDLLALAAETGPSLSELANAVDEIDDSTVEGVHEKERRHRELLDSFAYTAERLKFDAWCAAFTMTKTEERLEQEQTSPVEIYYRTAAGHDVALEGEGVQAVVEERVRVDFFHWPVEFPGVADAGGFDLLIGNPPWERIKLQEKEWFANQGRQDVADARNAAARKKAIKAIAESRDPLEQELFDDWVQDSHDADALSQFARKSERFPLGGVGDVNTYSVFADHFVSSVSDRGRVGILVPTGIITDYTYRDFFATLVDEHRLALAYDFENRVKLFPDVDSRFRFTTLVVTASGGSPEARFAFMVHNPSELADPSRSYVLSAEDIALVNPNTKTAPVFLTPRDAAITTKIYRRHPILIEHDKPDGNPWGVSFMRMFDMANDADLFHIAEELEAQGWKLNGNIYERNGERLLPLYEAKFFTHFDHREKDYSKTDRDKLFVARAYAYPFEHHRDPSAEVLSRYWVPEHEVHDQLGDQSQDTLLAWADVTAATNHRSCVTALLPEVAAGHVVLLAFPDAGQPAQPLLLAVWGSFAFDYVARQKISGIHFSYSIMEQLPVPSPETFQTPTPWCPDVSLGRWVAARAAALSAPTHLMADSLGYPAPVIWDGQQRRSWRLELDAALFHVFGYGREDIAFVMDTFPIVARADRKEEGLEEGDPNWRTKREILAKFDELQRHVATGTAYESKEPPPELPARLRLNAVGT